jgi:HD domain
VRAAAAVHDIGKVRVPPGVLDKPGRLTSAEFELVKRHADVGAEIVACLGDPELTAIVRHHHERFDGTGYPTGLAFERIPVGARIIAVSDTFDALTSVRPYRPAASRRRALEALVDASGTQLDPVAVRAFLRSYSGNKAIVFWSLLTISPQRALSWLGNRSRAPGHASLGPAATTVAAITAIAVTATSPPIGPRPGPSGTHDVYQTAPRTIATASFPSAIGAPRRTWHHTGPHLTALPALRRGHAAQRLGRVSAASRSAASLTRSGITSIQRHASASRSGGKPSGGSRPKPARGSGGSGGGPAGGSTGVPGGGSGGPAGGSTGVPGGGPGDRSGRGSSSGPEAGGGSGSGETVSGAVGGSPDESSGGSSGASETTGQGRAGVPSTKDKCKDGGHARYAFANQGQCVAFVEPDPR